MSKKVIELVPQKASPFEGPEAELYHKLNELIWDKIDGLTCIGAVGVLEYVKHETMHVAINAETEGE